jgi:hypothetical protein
VDFRASVGFPADKRHPDVLKHSLASHLVAGNCDLALAKQQLGHASISSTMFYIGTSDQQASEAASAVLMATYRGERMKSELSEKKSWEWIAAQIREHGLPKRGRPKKVSVDPDFDRLADALLIRAERAIARLRLSDRQRSDLIAVMRSRLRSLVTLTDRRSSPRKP